jgi:hypothetical protein
MKTHENVKKPFPVTTTDKRLKTLNEDGIVLVVVMFLLAVLSLIALAAGRSVTTDTAIASNYLGSIQALYEAEAGLERAKNECAQRYLAGPWTSFNTILLGADTTAGTSDDGILTFGAGDVGFHGGYFSAKVLNDYGDSGGATGDTNKTITIESQGTYGSSKATLRTTIRMNELMDLPGAVNLVGGYGTDFTGSNSFTIDGRDYKITDPEGSPTGTASETYGISVCDVGNASTAISAITSTLSSQQYDNVQGQGTSDPSIGEGVTVNKNNLREFVDSIKYIADTSLTDPEDLKGNTSGTENCLTTKAGTTVCLGSLANPKVTYVKAANDSSLEVTGTINGVGLLVVDGENLTFKGNINWIGVVIVLGSNIQFTDDGGGASQNIKGGLLVGEYAATTSGLDFKINGNVKAMYSREAVNLINTDLKNSHKYSVISWQRVY